VLLAGAIEVNALAQGALRQFTQWLWIKHPTFQLGGGHFTTELISKNSEKTYFVRLFWSLKTRQTSLKKSDIHNLVSKLNWQP